MSGTKKTKKSGKVGATKRRRRTNRRKGIAGFSDINFMAVLGAIGGAYVGKMAKDYALDPATDKGIQFAKDNPNMVDYILLAAGVFATTQDNDILAGAGYGLAAKAGADVITNLMSDSVGYADATADERPDYLYGNNGEPVAQLDKNTGNYMTVPAANAEYQPDKIFGAWKVKVQG